jgi:hypothetical protein
LNKFYDLLSPGSSKQTWKEQGNYYTAEELAKLDADIQADIDGGTLTFKSSSEAPMNGD